MNEYSYEICTSYAIFYTYCAIMCRIMNPIHISSSYFKLIYDFINKFQYHTYFKSDLRNKLFKISQENFSVKYPITEFNIFFEKIKEIHSPNDLIFDLIKTLEFKHYGLIAYLATYASNLEDALIYLEKFSYLLIDPGDFEGLKVKKKYMEYEIFWPQWNNDCIVIHAINIAAMSSLLERILELKSTESTFEAIEFASEKIRPLDDYQNFYHCDLKFSQENYCIRVSHAKLKVDMKNSDQQLLEVLLSQAEIALAQTKSKQENIKNKVVNLLHHYVDASLAIPSSESLAKMLNMSRRTLHRKLEAQDLSYRNLVIETKMQHCMKLLKYSNLALTDIAISLGYTNQSSLGRSFKQYYGYSMSRIRSN